MLKNGNGYLAVVTGAARRLGRDLAISLAQRGYSVVVHCHSSRMDAEKTIEEVQKAGNQAFLAFGDLREPESINGLFSVVDLIKLPLKVMVNSAAVMTPINLRDVDVDNFDDVVDLNLRAPLVISKLAASRMSEGGVIVNISDVGAQKNWTGYPVYTISKNGLEVSTKLLAKTFAPKIRVNAIAPGLVYRSETIEDSEWNKLLSKVPMGRAADPAEITSALDFILDNEYLTGQTIVVDGGYSLV